MNETEKEIHQRREDAKNKRKQHDPIWNELDQFDRGEQWKGEFPRWIPRPVTNWVHMVKVTKRAAFAIENPVGQILPLTMADKDLAKQFQTVYEYEWNRINAAKYLRAAVETGKLMGTGIVQFYWDEQDFIRGGGKTGEGARDGEIKIRHLDIAQFYPDPTAFELEDCRYIHVTERKTVDWLKKHPLFNSSDIDNAVSSVDERGEIYNRDYNSTTSAKSDIVDFHSHYEKIPLEDGGFKYKLTYLAGDKIIHTVDPLKPNCYPFAIYRDYPQRHDFWGKGTCEIILSNQKIINKVEGIIALIGTQLQNPQKIVSKGSGINPREVAKYGSAPGHVYVANGQRPDLAITWAQPPQIPQYLFQLAERAEYNIREITGISESYQGQSVGSVQTSGGVEQLIERATMRDRDQMFEIEEFVEDMTRILMRFVTYYHSEKRHARYEDEFGNFEFAEYLGTEFEEIDYEFRIDANAKSPMSRQKLQETADHLLELQGQYQHDPAVINPEEYIEMSSFPNEIKRRLRQRMENERMVNNTESLVQVGMMIAEAIGEGVPGEEVEQMAQEMVEQREAQRKQGIGSAHGNDMGGGEENSGQTQNQQAGPGGGR